MPLPLTLPHSSLFSFPVCCGKVSQATKPQNGTFLSKGVWLAAIQTPQLVPGANPSSANNFLCNYNDTKTSSKHNCAVFLNKLHSFLSTCIFTRKSTEAGECIKMCRPLNVFLIFNPRIANGGKIPSSPLSSPELWNRQRSSNALSLTFPKYVWATNWVKFCL